MTDYRRFTTVWGFSNDLDKLFKEWAGLEQEIKKQLVGLVLNG